MSRSAWVRALALSAWVLAPGGALAAELMPRGQYVWSSEDARFGGFSGLWMRADGGEILGLSDRGAYARGTVVRAGGAIRAIEGTEVTTLPLDKPRPASGYLIDAEGLAVGPEGEIYVSYEGYHRVWKFNPEFEDPEWLHKWDFFLDLQDNSGLEALAVDTRGWVYAIPERSGKWERPFPIQRYRGGAWDTALQLPRSKRFLVVGADIGPDGMLYVLERDFEVLTGFKTRIRRFEIGETALGPEEILLETWFSRSGNAEGISLWTDPEGQIVVTLISDNNFTGVLRTLVTEYTLVEDAPQTNTN